jgi:hypothetical protein
LVAAAVRLGVPPSDIVVPLAAAIDGAWTCPAAELARDQRRGLRLVKHPVLYATSASPLTEALAAGGQRILLAPTGEALAAHVAAGLERGFEAVTDAYAHLEAASPRRGQLLLETLARYLEAAGLAPPSLSLVTAPEGVLERAAVAVAKAGPPFVIHRHASSQWSARGAVAPVALWSDHPVVKAALRRIRPGDPSAAELLARYLLVEERGELSRGQAEAFWTATEAP